MTPPGEYLRVEVEKRGLQKKDIARRIGMDPSHLSGLFTGRRRFTAYMALRLEKTLKIPADFWMRAQADWELERARDKFKD